VKMTMINYAALILFSMDLYYLGGCCKGSALQDPALSLATLTCNSSGEKMIGVAEAQFWSFLSNWFRNWFSTLFFEFLIQ